MPGVLPDYADERDTMLILDALKRIREAANNKLARKAVLKYDEVFETVYNNIIADNDRRKELARGEANMRLLSYAERIEKKYNDYADGRMK